MTMATATEQIYAAQIDRHRDHLALLRAQVYKEQYLTTQRKDMLVLGLDLVDGMLNDMAHTLRQ